MKKKTKVSLKFSVNALMEIIVKKMQKALNNRSVGEQERERLRATTKKKTFYKEEIGKYHWIKNSIRDLFKNM